LFIQKGTGNNYVPEKFYGLLTLNKKVLAVVPNPIAYEEIANRDGDVYATHIKKSSADCRGVLENVWGLGKGRRGSSL